MPQRFAVGAAEALSSQAVAPIVGRRRPCDNIGNAIAIQILKLILKSSAILAEQSKGNIRLPSQAARVAGHDVQ